MNFKTFKSIKVSSLIKSIVFGFFISFFISGCHHARKIESEKINGLYYYEPNPELRKNSDYSSWDYSIERPNLNVLKKIIAVGRQHCKYDKDLGSHIANEGEDNLANLKYYNQRITYLCRNGRTILAEGGDVKNYVMTKEDEEINP